MIERKFGKKKYIKKVLFLFLLFSFAKVMYVFFLESKSIDKLIKFFTILMLYMILCGVLNV